MKKILCLSLALLLLVSLFPLSAFGAGKGKVSIVGGPEEFRRGTAFDVEVELNRNPGFLSLRVEVAFDPMVLKVVNVTNLSTLPGFQHEIGEDGVILRYKKDSGQDLTATGKLARIRFQVKDNAIYGDSEISPIISQKLYDAVNSEGKAISFDTVPLTLHLACPHRNTTQNVLTPATFEALGTAEEVCSDCSLVTPVTLTPTLSSEDGKTKATLEIGEYLEADAKSIRTEYLFSGPEVDKAKELFSDSLLRCFSVSFTKNAAPFAPDKPSQITLEPDFDLPEVVALYVLTGEEARQIEVKKEEALLSFPYTPGAYVLVSRSNEEPNIPETTAPKKTTVEESKEFDPDEEARKKELLLIGGGIFALFLCGGAFLILLRSKQNF